MPEINTTFESSLSHPNYQKSLVMEVNREIDGPQREDCLLSQKLLAIWEHERLKLSLDLHDTIARDLSALKLISQDLLATPSQGVHKPTQRMDQWTNLLDHCIDSVQDLANSLRPPDLSQTGLGQAVAALCHEVEQEIGTAIRFRSTGLSRLCPITDYDIAVNLYRVAQEALNNIKQHASAQKVQIRIVAAGSSILLSIEDDGRGFDLAEFRRRITHSNRFGLLEMEERIRVLDGTIDIRSTPGKGTKIFIEIPWQEMYGNERNDYSSSMNTRVFGK